MTENINSYQRYKPIISARSYYKENQMVKDQEELDKRIDQIDKDFKLREGAVLGDRIRVRKNQFAEALHGKGRDENVQNLLQSVVFETFLDALYLDSQAKSENINMLRKIFNDHYDSVGAKDVFSGIRILGPLASQKYSENPLLFKMKSICESAVDKFSSRRSDEVKNLQYEDMVDELLDFDMTEEEHEDFVYDKQNIQLDDISDKIKDRVINTIVEEKRISEEEFEREEELKNSGADDDDEYGEDTEVVTESYRQPNLIRHSQPIFMSIMESVVQHTIESSKPMINEKIDSAILKYQYMDELSAHAGQDYYHEAHKMDGKKSHAHPRLGNGSMESTSHNTTITGHRQQLDRIDDRKEDFQSMNEDSDNSLSDDYLERNMVIDRDLVLADSMIHYTLLETFHTLQIMKQTPSSVQELCSTLRTY